MATKPGNARFDESFRNMVESARISKKWTKRKLHKETGIHPSYLTVICRDGAVPSREYTDRLSAALGIPRDHLRAAAGYAVDAAVLDYPVTDKRLQRAMVELSHLSHAEQRAWAKKIREWVADMANHGAEKV